MLWPISRHDKHHCDTSPVLPPPTAVVLTQGRVSGCLNSPLCPQALTEQEQLYNHRPWPMPTDKARHPDSQVKRRMQELLVIILISLQQKTPRHESLSFNLMRTRSFAAVKLQRSSDGISVTRTQRWNRLSGSLQRWTNKRRNKQASLCYLGQTFRLFVFIS
jgi:hypothetical protein